MKIIAKLGFDGILVHARNIRNFFHGLHPKRDISIFCIELYSVIYKLVTRLLVEQWSKIYVLCLKLHSGDFSLLLSMSVLQSFPVDVKVRVDYYFFHRYCNMIC